MDSATGEQATAVCLVSGGMDSCVAAAVAARENTRLAFLHAAYGQRTERRELAAFHALADHYRVPLRLVCSLDHLARIGGSALTDPAVPVPEGKLDRVGIPLSYVPFRNAGMLGAAVAWAEVLGARSVYIGAVEEDGSGYPDCRQEFFQAFQAVVDLGTRPGSGIRICTPLIRMTKEQIVRRGLSLGAPFHLTWSCYQETAVACGTCDSCLLRLRGFARAGAADPVPYRGSGAGA